MGWYRLYFLGKHGDVRNVDEFHTASDALALVLADGLYDAVSDVHSGYELWHDSVRLYRCASPAAPRPFVASQVITAHMQADLLRRGDADGQRHGVRAQLAAARANARDARGGRAAAARPPG